MTKKFLVVDDDEDIRHFLLRFLEGLGDVVTVSSGKDALKFLEKERPNLMLLDFEMPGMNGLEVLKAARQVAPSVPILMLTGESDVALAKKALDGGVEAYITKPFDVDMLRSEVLRLIQVDTRTSPSARPWQVRADPTKSEP